MDSSNIQVVVVIRKRGVQSFLLVAAHSQRYDRRH